MTLGVQFIFIISLMHTLSDKVRFVQRKLKPEEAFTTKKWMVLAERLLAQAHYIYMQYTVIFSYPCTSIVLSVSLTLGVQLSPFLTVLPDIWRMILVHVCTAHTAETEIMYIYITNKNNTE